MEATIEKIWDGECYIYIVYLDGKHIATSYDYESAKKLANEQK